MSVGGAVTGALNQCVGSLGTQHAPRLRPNKKWAVGCCKTGRRVPGVWGRVKYTEGGTGGAAREA